MTGLDRPWSAGSAIGATAIRADSDTTPAPAYNPHAMLTSRTCRVAIAILGAAILLRGLVAEPVARQRASDFWITTWATALVARPPAPVPSSSAPASPAGRPELANQTVRQVIHTGMGGSSARVVLSNVFGTTPLVVGAAALAVRDAGPAIRPETVRRLSFQGASAITLAPGASVESDEISLFIPSLDDLVVDLYLPGTTATASPVTMHPAAAQPTYLSAPGNFVGARTLEPRSVVRQSFLLSRLDVVGNPGSATVVTIGGSITDGSAATPDSNRRWTDRLATRLTNWNSRLGIANMGIAGNRLLGTGSPLYGQGVLERFDRDVLALPNVQFVVVLAGLNDIGVPARTDGDLAARLIEGHRQVVARAHAGGLMAIGTTLTPFEGASYYSEAGEATRQRVNAWMRTSGVYDAVVDFDALLRDPARPSRLLPNYDSGDHLHPSDAGHAALGDAFPLEVFGPPSNRR